MSIDTFLLSSDTTDLDYPEIRPTLDLNFARVKALDPRITFTRASGGSYVGADGLIKLAGVNEARFDHDPYTGESLGLLIEEARTNNIDRSEEFVGIWSLDQVGPNPINMSTTTILSPDGRSFFTLGTYGRNDIRRSFSGGSGKTYTASCFYKQPDNNTAPDAKFEVHITGGTTTNSRITYNFSSNSITRLISNSSSFTGGFERYSNGVVRVYLTFTDDGDGTNVFFLNLRDDASPRLIDGKQILFWGAQVEEGPFPTSYIPTEGSTRTRAADNARIIGKNFSEWYRPDEGSIFVNFKGKSQEGTSFERVYSINLNSIPSVEEILLVNNIGFNPDRIGYLVYTNSVNTQDTSGTTGGFVLASSNPVKTAMCYKTASYAYVFNGGTVITRFDTRVPTVNTLDIGRAGAGSQLNGTISRLTYYPKRLPNAQLQALTR